MMKIIVINFKNKQFQIGLFINNNKIEEIEEIDAAKNLIYSIDLLLNKYQLNLNDIDKIGFLIGPGSFTSARIICAICLGIQMVQKNILFIPMRIDQATEYLYPETSIIIECNTVFYHVYCSNKWQLLSVHDIKQIHFNNLIAPHDIKIQCNANNLLQSIDLMQCIFEYSLSVNYVQEIKPFYGMEI